MNELVSKFKQTEKTIDDLFIKNRGIPCRVTPVLNIKNRETQNDNDPFEVPTKWETHQYGTIREYGATRDESLFFEQEGFNFQTTSIERVVGEYDSETFPDLMGRITGDYLPIHSKVEFTFEGKTYGFEIGESRAIRANSLVYRYHIVRV
jgi:hypothetical protein